jgi:preprotein translocase subunit YajC
MLNAFILFAQQEGDKAPPTGLDALIGNPIILLPVLFAIFYFTIILPQSRRQRKDQESLMTGLKKNDEVVTTSGIIGIIAHIKETGDEVTLKIDDNARIRVLKSSILRIVNKDALKDSAAANTGIKPTT